MYAYARLVFVPRFSRFFLMLFLASVSAASFAIDRPLPLDAKLGKLSASYKTPLVINGKKYSLSAGAQIRDQHNRIVLPQSLSVSDAPVLYQINESAQIYRVWILTGEEAVHYVPVLPLTPPVTAPLKRAKSSNGI